jgi:predicted RecA/RadA family phage recombinase
MKNRVQEGNALAVAAPSGGVESGDPVAVGSIKGFAAFKAAEGELVTVERAGVFTVTKEAGAAWTVGAKVYLKATTKIFNVTSGGNTLFGFAVEAADSASTTGTICLFDGAN